MMLPKFSKLGTVLLAGYLAWLGWDQFGPHKPEIGPLRKEAAEQAVSAIAEDLRLNRGDIGPVVLLPFAGDSTSYFTDRLRTTLEQRGTLDLQPRSFAENLHAAANLRPPAAGSLDAAIASAQSRGASGVLFGRLLRFESTDVAAALEVEYTLADVATGGVIHQGRFSNTAAPGELFSPEATALVRSIPWFQRGLGWIVVVLLLPVFTIGFIRTLVARRSNGVNAFVLCIYTVVDAILAYLLVGAALAGFWTAAAFVLAVLIALAYNIRIMSFAVKMEE
jgi:hypothetical protein